MRDPELVARAQRAAARLEWAWERWRARRGFGGALSQPVASYVGYAPDEPRGRPRVVFGVDALEAEQLALLLDSDTREGEASGTGAPATAGATCCPRPLAPKADRPSRKRPRAVTPGRQDHRVPFLGKQGVRTAKAPWRMAPCPPGSAQAPAREAPGHRPNRQGSRAWRTRPPPATAHPVRRPRRPLRSPRQEVWRLPAIKQSQVRMYREVRHRPPRRRRRPQRPRPPRQSYGRQNRRRPQCHVILRCLLTLKCLVIHQRHLKPQRRP
jgi:hypothetical protein